MDSSWFKKMLPEEPEVPLLGQSVMVYLPVDAWEMVNKVAMEWDLTQGQAVSFLAFMGAFFSEEDDPLEQSQCDS